MIRTDADIHADIEERRRAERRYEAAVARVAGAPSLHTFLANDNGHRVVTLDGDQVGYVAGPSPHNKFTRRRSWRGILGPERATIVAGADSMAVARRAICVEHLRRLEREVAGELALAVALLRDLYPQAAVLRHGLAELRDRMLRDDPCPGWPAAPHAVREAAVRMLTVLGEVDP